MKKRRRADMILIMFAAAFILAVVIAGSYGR